MVLKLLGRVLQSNSPTGIIISVFSWCFLIASNSLLAQTVIVDQTEHRISGYTVDIPANSIVTVEVWGAGGAGGGAGDKNSGYGGGGGGAYSKISFNNLTLTSYSYFVGSGGDRNNDGESSYFDQLGLNHVEAGGGQSVVTGSITGGTGGIVIVGTGENGGDGADGTPGVNGLGGGGGSSAGVAIDGTPIAGNSGTGRLGGAAPNDGGAGANGGTSGANGNNGIQVGAGGGGGHRQNAGGIKGGDGADGRIRITVTFYCFLNTWTGNISDDWNESGNWSCGEVPSDSDNGNVFITHVSPNPSPVIQSAGAAGYAFSLEIDATGSLEIQDNFIDIEDVLRIDGLLSLTGEAQLLQQTGSTFDDASTGYLERTQQGTADLYTYNYWSSPVYTNNSVVSGYGASMYNNYTVADILPGITFVSGYDGSPASNIAEYWIFKFNDKLAGDYSQWSQILSTGDVVAGEGFTMKGPGTGDVTDEFSYVFQGKPNNGDITLELAAGNGYLLGNPYPSALDADQFIFDNVNNLSPSPVFDGTLYYWEHLGGGSHNLTDYQGGYATYNLSGGVGSGGGIVAPPGLGSKIPQRYIPVGQGFFVNADAGGTITFNNGQRTFVTEGASSVFFKNQRQEKFADNDARRKLRIGVEMSKGFKKEILLTEDINATNQFDYGYDGKLIDGYNHDIYWSLGDQMFCIQGVPSITKNSVFELGILMESDGEIVLRVNEFENNRGLKKVYLLDRETKKSTEIVGGSVTLNLNEGNHKGRFAITFLPREKSVTNRSELHSGIETIMNNAYKELQITKMVEAEIQEVALFNILGQKVHSTTSGLSDRFIRIPVHQQQGVYLLKIATNKGPVGKRIIIEE